MKKLITIVFIAIATSVFASAQNGKAEQEILNIHKALDQAFVKQDIALFEATLADDFVSSGSYGKSFDRAAALADIRKEWAEANYKVISNTIENPKVRIMGNTAVLTADWTFASALKVPANAEPHHDKGRYTGVYEKRNGKWMLIADHWSELPHDKALMEQQVMKMGLAYGEIIKRQDVAAVERLYADEYIFTNERGQVKNKAQDIEQWKTKPAKFERFDISDQKVRVIGNNAAVETGTVTFKGAAHDGKPFEGSERYTTTWIWRGGRWQIAADHVSTIAK